MHQRSAWPRALLAILLIIGGIGAAVAVALALWERGFYYRPDPSRFPVLGIDVSHHQGQINWALVSDDDIRFAYIKATEGSDFKDTRFLENWRGAREAGLRIGAYHYFSFCSAGAAQAEHFLATVPQGEATLPPALDLELGSSCRATPGRDEIRKELFAWLALVEQRTGLRPVLYLTEESLEALVEQADFQGHPEKGPRLWYRSLLSEPSLPFPVEWTFWQHHSRGRIAGIEGPVDLDVFAQDEQALRLLLGDQLRHKEGDGGIGG